MALICHCLCTGKHTASGGEAECVACGAGKYAASPLSATACVDCGAGKYSAASGATAESTCLACTANADAPAGSDECMCNAGFTSDDAGGCQACVAGTYKSGSGNDTCTDCGAGKYAASPLSATACVDCAAGKHLASTGNDAESDCVACAAGADTCFALP